MNPTPLDTPWKILNELRRILAYPLVRILFLTNRIPWGRNWFYYGLPIIQKHRHSVISLGSDISLRSTVRSNPLGANHPVILCTWQAGAVLEIGDHFGMTGGSICAAEKVSIGNHVNVGANSTIIDTDFHPLDPEFRQRTSQQAETAPVRIEDHAFIGMNCLILKGVTIGHGSIIGAGSVVTHDVPPEVVAAGNPAVVVRNL